MEHQPVCELLDVAVECPGFDQFQVEILRAMEDRVQAVWPVITGNSVIWTRSAKPAAISARFIDRLPWERTGTSDSCLSRATTSTASPRAMSRPARRGVMSALSAS